MKLLHHEPNAIDLRTTPVHLGLGSRAKPVEGFSWNPEVLQAYSAAVAADGDEGRLVTIFDGHGPGDHWERHPVGDELVICLSGSVTVTRDMDGAHERVVLGPGEATVNPAGTWHAVDMAGPASILTITAGLGTGHRPRAEAPPAEHADPAGPRTP
ncbi:cupin domain-containing protein [Streptomyces sp. NPDC020875]|uniref:cupin domain-containing protein n=1 Tax=Streptomyces sp. NPDC020875 TaxID=3154898 RepID=UPI003401098E